MDSSLNKPSNRLLAIAKHLLNISGFAKNFRDSNFSIKSKARNDYHLCVLESLFKKISSNRLKIYKIE